MKADKFSWGGAVYDLKFPLPIFLPIEVHIWLKIQYIEEEEKIYYQDLLENSSKFCRIWLPSWSVGCLKTKICKHDAKNSGDSCDVLVIGRWQWIECSGGGGHFTSFDQSTASLQIPSWEAGNRKDRRCRCWQIDIYSFGEQPLVYFASTSRTLTVWSKLWNFGSIAKCRRIYGSRVKVASWNETLWTIWGWFLQITPHVERCLIHTPSTCHRLYLRDGWPNLLWHNTFHSPALTFNSTDVTPTEHSTFAYIHYFGRSTPFGEITFLQRCVFSLLINVTAFTLRCST